MKTIATWVSLVLVAGFLLAGCGSAAPGGATQPTSQATQPGQPDWQQKWNTTVEAAKKEGTVTIYSIWSPEVRTALTQAFKDKYGIALEFSPFTRGSDLLVKVQAEQRAGLYNVDIFGAGNPTFLVNMKPEGVLGSLKPSLILPEVLDGKGWRAGQVPFTDEQGSAISLVGLNIRTVAYNTEQVKNGEITGYPDFLKPQYKGKITMNDPSVTGAGNAVMSHLGGQLWDEARATDFLTRLIKDQKVNIERDNRIQMDGVARAKYAIAIAPLPEEVTRLMGVGAPVKMGVVPEDNRITAGTGAMGVPPKFAHPNAAVVFINWILSKEGMTVVAQAWANPSTRADVPVTGIDPLLVPVAGQKYYGESEAALASRAKWLELAAKIMQQNQ